MLKIYYNNFHSFVLRKKIKQVFSLALEKKFDKRKNFVVGIRFAGEKEIKNLNKKFRNIDRATDVLSFPIFDFNVENLPQEDNIMLGDIVICKKIAKLQAKKFGHGTLREIIFLSLHGFLHLLGLDHEEKKDEEEMKAFSDEILKKAGVLR